MKKIDWDRLVPLGISGRKVRNGLLAAWGIGVGWSLRFLAAYVSAYKGLYYRTEQGMVIWLTGAKMPPVETLLSGCFLILELAAAAMLPLAVGLYLYHTVGSHSIYTMKRLKNPWELWWRVAVMPGCMAIVCLLTKWLLVGVYCAIYWHITPVACLT